MVLCRSTVARLPAPALPPSPPPANQPLAAEPLPPPPPIDCARTPDDPSNFVGSTYCPVTMLIPEPVTETVPAAPPIEPAPPLGPTTNLLAEPPSPPLPPRDWASTPGEYAPAARIEPP